jgi:ElaB/YqjD/DUF883 family membrane-anchored ribosome-binding protein
MNLAETQKALRIAKTEIAHLYHALEDIAESKGDDADELRQEAQYALSQHSPRFEQEAEELRSGIEKLIESALPVRELVEWDMETSVVQVSQLSGMLNDVDARDSLAWLEKSKKLAPRIARNKK